MELTQMPNIGPKVAAKLRRLGVESMEDLRGGDGEALFERLCAMDGQRHDPCLLDTFVAAVDFANGAPARPWWEYSRERLAAGSGATPSRPTRTPSDASREAGVAEVFRSGA